jgi:quinolinate synthase
MPEHLINVVAECARAMLGRSTTRSLAPLTKVMSQTTFATATDLSPLPFEAFRAFTDAELEGRIKSVKQQMGDSLLILGHHYQQDEVIRFADLRGDSYKLSQLAAESQTCRAIVFCGVHFMAETADVLSREHVEVYLPDLGAGCSMADMADLESVEAAWQDLADVVDTNDITPVTYINSSAELKAFCGRHGGIVCTSSNARAVLDWSFSKRGRVLFFPDQHLGRNTARAMGVPLDQMAVWDPREPLGGNTEAAVRASRVLLWKGHCSVHQMFKPIHVKQFRGRFPDSKILVHPECMMQVVDVADLVGSTEFIIKTISSAPAGSTWGVGTELHLVNRLAHENPDKTIHFLSPMVCMCATMYRIDPPHLAWCLENLVRGTPVNQIKVPAETAHWARISLERMLQVV